MMFKAALLAVIGALAVSSVAAAPLAEEQYEFLYMKYIKEFNKSHEMSNTLNRYNIFKSNIDLIVAHNARGDSWQMGVNEYTDMTAAEFGAMMGFKPAGLETVAAEMIQGTFIEPTQQQSNSNATLKDSPDWSNKFKPVENQGSCGSCYSFSSIGTLEATYNIQKGKLPDLSNQQIVDCSSAYGNHGCDGGLMTNTYNYLKAKGGSCTNADYGYTAKQGSCKPCTGSVQVAGYTRIGDGVSGLSTGLQKGPIAVALAAGNSAFQMYKSGILTNCNSVRQDHAVIAVAYNASENYVLIRNSWGGAWGDKGHIKISTKGDMCGLGKSGADVQPILG